MTRGKIYTLSTCVFYLILIPLIPALDHYSPGGPCNPGLGLLLLMLTLAIAVVGLLISVIARVMGKHAFSGPAIVNSVVLLVIIFFIKFSGF
jgi:hypothetical protein